MAELLELYTPALRAFLLGPRRVPEDLVDDLVHDFIADKILGRNLVARAEQRKGRFRNYLLKAFSNFVATRLKRDGRLAARISDEDVEGLADLGSSRRVAHFDQEWVRLVVTDALALMQAECEEDGRGDLWNVFTLRVVEPLLHDGEMIGYDELVGRLGIATPRQAINLLVTAKRRFVRHLRAAVGRYVHGEEQIDNEIEALREIVQT